MGYKIKALTRISHFKMIHRITYVQTVCINNLTLWNQSLKALLEKLACHLA